MMGYLRIIVEDWMVVGCKNLVDSYLERDYRGWSSVGE
jgi:hypothetical protein